jgi:aryl-alcohol dehydrogenase-like predicted oxidoreductase
VISGFSGLWHRKARDHRARFGYAVLLGGIYGRADRPVPQQYQHAATDAQLAAVRDIAVRLGAIANQVVLAWLIAAQPGIIPVLGVSRPDQLEEALAAAEVMLDEQALGDLASARALSTTG